jgi:ADP-ribose pyrophosphatase YjhB (NUDIX family)
MSGASAAPAAPAGPQTGGRSPTPVFQPTARCFVLDGAGRVLLFGGEVSPTAGRTWFTPGGGLRAGESLPEAASRELAEETGLRIPATELGRAVSCAGRWPATCRIRRYGCRSAHTELAPADCDPRGI